MVCMFNTENQKKLRQGLDEVRIKVDTLVLALNVRQYGTAGGKEYALNGLARRLRTIERCIQNVYRQLPPDLTGIPESDVIYDAMINIQAAVFNTFGAIDNLAFIWVFERGVVGRNGKQLPNGRIGLTRDKSQVRESFSPEMQQYLGSTDPWFDNLESFRHSLGHRIPLYIPPYCIAPEDADRYSDLDRQASHALLAGKLEEHSLLRTDQDALRHFKPIMQQSLNTPKPPVVFHAQLLADLNTVEKLCQKVFLEMDR